MMTCLHWIRVRLCQASCHGSVQPGTKPKMVAKILATNFGFVPDGYTWYMGNCQRHHQNYDLLQTVWSIQYGAIITWSIFTKYYQYTSYSSLMIYWVSIVSLISDYVVPKSLQCCTEHHTVTDLLPDGTEPMLMFHKWGPVVFTGWHFHMQFWRYQSLQWVTILHFQNYIS